MYNLVYPDYDNCVMNITVSVLKHFGVKSKYASLPVLDRELQKQYKNVIVFLIDGMGSEILKKHAKVVPNLLRKQAAVVTSVFPSTTVAATTSILTGLPPVTTGWIGWFQYIKEEKRSVIFYYNSDFYEQEYKFNYNVAEKYAPVKNVYTQIQEVDPEIVTEEIFPEFREPKHNKFDKICETIVEKAKEPGRKYIYAYWEKLDSYMHHEGTSTAKIHDHLKEIDDGFKYLCDNLDDDTLLILTADHGQVDIDEVVVGDYPKLVETFRHYPSIEARATAFFVKKDLKKQFEEEFKRNFRDKFILLKSEEVFKTNLLGIGKPHKKAKEFLGDYFAMAIDKYSFKLFRGDANPFKGQHAGLTKDEMLVPIIINSPKQ